MRLLSAAIALILLPVAAHADWSPTKWGMTPAQVIAAIPGASAVQHRSGMDVLGNHLLVAAPITDDAIGLTANFYFEPRKRQLTLIQFIPPKERCGAYFDQLVARLGKGKRDDTVTDQLDMRKVDWADPATQDRLSFAWVLFTKDGSSMYCHFMQQGPD